MLKKVVITGPESSGKTTLAQQLAEVLDCHWVPEFAREYLDGIDRDYRESDLLLIAKGQIKLEDSFSIKADQYLICDTDLLTIKIWSEYKYQCCDPFILNELENRIYELYFLCTPDVPWQPDPIRENPNDRDQLFIRYEEELLFYKKNYIIIKGTEQQRLQNALNVIKE